MTTPMTERQKLIREIPILLGADMVKVEITPDTVDLALQIALDRYRQRSVNATEERLAFLDLPIRFNILLFMILLFLSHSSSLIEINLISFSLHERYLFK